MQRTHTGIIVLILFVYAGLLACQGEPPTPPKPKPSSPPSGLRAASPLTQLMRKMFTETQALKKALKNGETYSVDVDFKAILSAEATVASKTDNAHYKALSASYVAIMEAMEAADLESAKSLYLSMYETCINCHKQVCPGPIVRIKKLDWAR